MNSSLPVFCMRKVSDAAAAALSTGREPRVNVPLPGSASLRPMRYAAFLRAVNLGRNRRVTSAQLKALFEEVGVDDVAPFRTSGNVVFAAPRDMRGALERHLEGALGHELVIFMRTASEVKQIAA